MRVVLQRVKEAKVFVESELKGQIASGYLLLVGIAENDDEIVVEKMADKIKKLRIFEDEAGKINVNILTAGGEILSVSQFTLLGNTKKGNRPGFDNAAVPERAKYLWQSFNNMLKSEDIRVAEGVFGAKMEVSLVNDGPVTFVLDSN